MYRSCTQLVALTMTVLMLAVDASAGPCWTEMADAGVLPGDPNTSPCGPAALQDIMGGAVGGADQEDMFLIFIPDPALFVARTDGGDGSVSTGDTQLWLFTFEGFGVATNDDSPMMPGPGSYIDNSGLLIPGPGFYYLAISQAGREPESAGGPIFDLTTGCPSQICGPDGTGGGQKIIVWTGSGASITYAPLALQGAEFPNGLGAPTLDGLNIPNEFGSDALVATQTNRSGFGNQTTTVGGLTSGSELDALYVRNDDANLYIGITGNLQTNANAWAIFIDTDDNAATGQQELQTQGVDSAGNGSFVMQSLGQPTTDCMTFGTGTLLPAGIGPEYAIVVDTLGGKLSVFEYNLTSCTIDPPCVPSCDYDCDGDGMAEEPLLAARKLVGTSPINDNNAILEGSGCDPPSGYAGGFNNTNEAGVTFASGGGAGTALNGLELSVPLLDLGLMANGATIRLFVLLASGGGTGIDLGSVHNQLLPFAIATNCAAVIMPFGTTPDLSAEGTVTHVLSMGNLPPPMPLDGQDVPGTFEPPALKATQNCPTSAGDQISDPNLLVISNGSESDQLFTSNDCQSLYVGLSGNAAPDGTRLIVFVDSTAGGESTLDGQADAELGGAVAGMEDDTLPDEEVTAAAVSYDYAVEINPAGGAAGPVYVNLYDLQANTRQYLGQTNECIGDGTLTGGVNPNDLRVAYNRGNLQGVTSCPDGNVSCFNDSRMMVMGQAAMATKGFEMVLPLADLGIGNIATATPDIHVWTYVAREDGFGSDQGLPPLRGAMQTEMQIVAGGGPTDFSVGDPMNPNQSYQTESPEQPVPPPCTPDVTKPTIALCGALLTADGDGDPCLGVVPAFSAVDQCGAPDVDVEIGGMPAPSTLAPGTYTVTITATDGSGNVASCSAFLTITECPAACAADTTPPTITFCPGNQIVPENGSSCTGTVPYLLGEPLAATDNCDGAITCSPTTCLQSPAAGMQVPVGVHAITITVMDAAGNSATCTPAPLLTVIDATPPMISMCPEDETVTGSDDPCMGAVPDFLDPPLMAADNCGGMVTLTQSPAEGVLLAPGTYPITIKATDPAGNFSTCTPTLTVTSCATIVSANPPLDNPYLRGTQPFRDVLQTGSTPAVSQGIGGPGTPGEGAISYAPISVTFNATPVPAPAPENVGIACTAGLCPTVTAASGSGVGPYLITLSGPIPPGECTTFTFAGTAPGTALKYQSLPGDIDMSGTTSATDVLRLMLAISLGIPNAASLARFDINRNGVVNAADTARLMELLSGVNTSEAWAGVSVVPCP